MLRFPFDERKALEAFVLIAQQWPGISAFFSAKVLFLAEKDHLNRFGRPIIGDRFIAMENGPVPSVIYDWYKGNLNLMGDPESIADAVEFNRNGRSIRATAKREPDLDFLSPSDIEALRAAIEFCKAKSFDVLSSITHRDPAWLAAELNGEMDPRLMIEGDRRERVIEEAEEFARYGLA